MKLARREVPVDLIRLGDAGDSCVVPTPIELDRKRELPKVAARFDAVLKELHNLEVDLRSMDILGSHDLQVARQYIANVASDVDNIMNPEGSR